MGERALPGYIIAQQLRYIASEEVAESFLCFSDHLRAGIAGGTYGGLVEELLARVQEAGLPAILKELARGDARLPWDTQVVDNEPVSEWLTLAERAKMVMCVHQAMSRILCGRFGKLTQFLLAQSTRFAALNPWLASMGATSESVVQERAANARAISACHNVMKRIATTADGGVFLARHASRALQRLRRAWGNMQRSVKFDYEVLPSVCDQVARAAIEHRDLSERLKQTLIRHARAAASGRSP
jgi:hypothetical protein